MAQGARRCNVLVYRNPARIVEHGPSPD